MISDRQQIEIIFQLEAVGADYVAGSVLAALGVRLNDEVALYEKSMAASNALKKIAASGRPYFSLESNEFSLDFGAVASFGLSTLRVRDVSGSFFDRWDELSDTFAESNGFVQAVVSNADYLFWQNADDPVVFAAHDRSCVGMPMVSNGLPEPLERLVVDCSRNPSRRVLRSGYVEAIGHVMWFGSRFWVALGEDRSAGLCSAYDSKFVSNNVLRIQASRCAFVDDSTRSEQEVLRQRVFGVAPRS